MDLRLKPRYTQTGMASNRDTGVNSPRGCVCGIEDTAKVSIGDAFAFTHFCLQTLSELFGEMFDQLLHFFLLGLFILGEVPPRVGYVPVGNCPNSHPLAGCIQLFDLLSGSVTYPVD